MKRSLVPQIEIIESANGQQFADQFNESIKRAFLENESERNDPSYTIDISGGNFRALITKEILIEEMDCVSDEYHEQGIYYKCRNCPYCDVPNDKRIRWSHCEIKESSVNKRHECCEYFYEELKAGRLEPVERS